MDEVVRLTSAIVQSKTSQDATVAALARATEAMARMSTALSSVAPIFPTLYGDDVVRDLPKVSPDSSVEEDLLAYYLSDLDRDTLVAFGLLPPF